MWNLFTQRMSFVVFFSLVFFHWFFFHWKNKEIKEKKHGLMQIVWAIKFCLQLYTKAYALGEDVCLKK